MEGDNATEAMLETLDSSLQQMNTRAARGARDEADLNQRQFKTADGGEPNYVTVLLAGDGIIVVTDLYEREDFAWSGEYDDQHVFDDLVSEGVLTEQ